MRLLAILWFFIPLVGCAQIPRPGTYPYTFQEKMQAAEHWQVFANRVAGQVVAVLKSDHSLLTEPVYIQSDNRTNDPKDPCYDRAPFKDTTFAQAFHSLLITELTNQGISISDNQNTKIQFCWTIQPVVHNSYRSRPYPSIAGTIFSTPPSPFADVWNGIDSRRLPHSEIIITTIITDNGIIQSRNSDVFYINDKDWKHYWSIPDVPQKSYVVVGR